MNLKDILRLRKNHRQDAIDPSPTEELEPTLLAAKEEVQTSSRSIEALRSRSPLLVSNTDHSLSDSEPRIMKPTSTTLKVRNGGSQDRDLERMNSSPRSLNLSKCGTAVSDRSLNSSHNSSVSGSNSKKKSNWFNTATYKQRSDEFHRLFKDIPTDERLLVDYSCALQRDILIHGRMYVTQNWICFYATIIKWETIVVIPTNKIRSITKEKTAKVIPNAIQINTANDKYFFSTFHSRDKSYLVMFRVWQNAMLENQMTNQQLWLYVHSLYGADLGLTASDDDYDVADSAPESDTSLTTVRRSKNATINSSNFGMISSPTLSNDSRTSPSAQQLNMNGHSNLEEVPQDLSSDYSDTTEDGRSTPSITPAVKTALAKAPLPAPSAGLRRMSLPLKRDEHEVTECPVDHEHCGSNVLDIEVNFSVDQMFDMLFTDSPFLQSFLADNQGTKDIVLGEWSEEPDEDGYKHKTNSFSIAINASFGPKSTPAVEKQRMGPDCKPGAYYCIDCENFNDPSLPYGENFTTWNRYCITKLGRHRCRLTVHSQIVYKKSIFALVRGIIEKNVKNGVNGYYRPLGDVLNQESEKKAHHDGVENGRVRKKKYRRRTGSISQAVRRPSLTKQPAVSSLSNGHAAGQLTQRSEQSQNGHYISSMVRVISCLLIFLVAFNLLLFYKLWSLESRYAQHDLALSQHQGHSPQFLVDLLNQQRDLYERDLDSFQKKLETSLLTIQQLQNNVQSLQGSLHKVQPNIPDSNTGPESFAERTTRFNDHEHNENEL